LHWGVEELKAISPRAKPVSGRGSGALATEEGGWRLLHRFGEVKQSTENTKRRKNKFGDFTRARRRSAKGSR